MIVCLLRRVRHSPVNIRNPNEMTVLQFAQEIKRLTGTNAPIEFRPLPEDDPRIRRPDISKAKALLKWEPRVPLDVGLKRTIDYFRSVLTQADLARVRFA